MSELTATDFLMARREMCRENKRCSACPLKKAGCYGIDDVRLSDITSQVEIVSGWMDEREGTSIETRKKTDTATEDCVEGETPER